MKRWLLSILLGIVLVGGIVLLGKTVQKILADTLPCPTNNWVIGKYCHQGQGVVYEVRFTNTCTVYSFNQNTACNFNTYAGTACNTAVASPGAAFKCDTGQVCDCGTNCRIPGQSPGGVACCTGTVCQSGNCYNGKCTAPAGSVTPGASGSGSLTPAPNATGSGTPNATSSSTPNADLRKKIFDVGYPTFNEIVKQALIVLPIIAAFMVLF